MLIASVPELLFDPQVIPEDVANDIPEGYSMRPIALDDYDKGVLDCLRGLTTVGDISQEMWDNQFKYWKKNHDQYFTLVITDAVQRVVAVGTLLMERKLIHECGLVGHIEDIAVAKDQQGKKLGIRLIKALIAIGKAQGAYKVILDCSDHNIGFYEKCGLVKAGVEMSIKFAEQQQKI